MNVYQNLKNHGLGVPVPSEDTPTIAMTKRFGKNFLYISGMGPLVDGKQKFCGTVPSVVPVDDAKCAAQHCALNILASIEKEIGDLNKVKNIVKVLAYVASDAGFNEQHIAANGASDVFIAAFGETVGKASRSAIGVAELPMGFPVEVEALIEIEE